MSKHLSNRAIRVLATGVGVIVLAAVYVIAREDQPKAKAPAGQSSAEENSLQRQLETIIALSSKEAAADASSDEARAEAIQTQQTIIKTADKLVASSGPAKLKRMATQLKIEALGKLAALGDDKALKQLSNLAQQLLKDNSPDAKPLRIAAYHTLAQARAQRLGKGEIGQASQLLNELLTAAAAQPENADMFRLIMAVIQHVESNEETQNLALDGYRRLALIAARSQNEKVSGIAKRLEGIIRRLDLVGKPMKIEGTLLSGEPFDPSTLKGKVVLVDFWATWCAPCIAELPNVLRNYKKYHDKGFEVVGISFDDDPDEVKKFVEERHIPWPILMGEDEKTRGWQHPLADYYGIVGIPTAILIGRDGKVVALEARGEQLGKWLEKLWGPAQEPKEEKTSSDENANSDGNK